MSFLFQKKLKKKLFCKKVSKIEMEHMEILRSKVYMTLRSVGNLPRLSWLSQIQLSYNNALNGKFKIF